MLMACGHGAQAQVTATSSSGSALPAVTVDAPAARQRPAASARRSVAATGARRAAARQGASATSSAQQAAAAAASRRTRTSDGTTGYVATRSSAGTKTDTPLIETPQSIAVISRQQIEAQQAQSLRDVARYAPGVYFSDDADFRFQNLNIRGFLADQYLDGMRLLSGTWSVPRIDPYFLERAEVISGPASVLYGQASPAGIVNLVSKRPTDTPLHEVQLQTGTFGRVQGAFDFSGPLDKDGTLLYRLTGIARDADTQVKNVGDQHLEIAPSLTWRPNENTSLTILSSYLYDPKAGFWNQLPLQGTLLPNKFGPIPRDFYVGDPSFERFSFKQAMIGYQFEHHFNDAVTVRQNLRYTDIDLSYAEVQGSVLKADQRTLTRNAYTADESLRTLSLDNQLEAKFRTGWLQHTALFGLDYQHKSWDNFTRFDLTGAATPTLDIVTPNYNQAIPLPPVFQNALQTQQQLGLYAQDQIKLDRLVFLTGVRQDWASTEMNDRKALTFTRQDDKAFTWRAGAIYQLDGGLAPYVNYATSFQPQLSGTTFDNSLLKPTTGEQYEVGVKYQPVGWTAFMTLAAYDLTQQNTVTPDPLHLNSVVQTGEANSRGVEVSVVGSPMPGLDLRASYTYINNRITSDNSGNVGHRLAGVPENAASLWADYTFQNGPVAGFGLGGGVRYVGESFATNANTLVVPDYTVFDATVHYDFGKLNPDLKGVRLAVNANNLLDRQYVSTCGALGCRWALGRTVLATMSYRW